MAMVETTRQKSIAICTFQPNKMVHHIRLEISKGRSASDKFARRALCYGVLALTKFAYPHQSGRIVLSSREAAASDYC